jgi:hypothetical protein
MFEKKDYTKMTLDELLKAEKMAKKNNLFSAGLIGFLIGIMVFGVANGGFGFVYIAIPLFLIFAIAKNSQIQKQNLLELQAEIKHRSANEGA